MAKRRTAWQRTVEAIWEAAERDGRQYIARYLAKGLVFREVDNDPIRVLDEMLGQLSWLKIKSSQFAWLMLQMGARPDIESSVLVQHKLYVFLRELAEAEPTLTETEKGEP